MKKNTAGGGSRNAKAKIFGANPLQVSEDVASRLMGGIVEKGFSSQTTQSASPMSGPRPTVLPFPVARHRSHGPHWSPNVAITKDVVDDDDYEEGEDYSGMDVVADFAYPLQRKEKKGLDFSRWQDVVRNDGQPVGSMKKKKMHSENFKGDSAGDRKPNLNSHNGDSVDHDTIMDDKDSTYGYEFNDIDNAKNEDTDNLMKPPANDVAKPQKSSMVEMDHVWRKEIPMHSETQRMLESPVGSGFSVENLEGDEEGSLENQIDAENRARLARMSADEIAEARAEITAKLSPELINALKKRAQSKLKRQKSSETNMVKGGEVEGMQHEKNLSEINVRSDNSDTGKPVEKVAGDIQMEENDYNSANVVPQHKSMWDAWSMRVESVRDMRFSLDGNILNSDVAKVSATGEASSLSEYSVDNVSERDFLRTDGDPSAAGYTIKEAVALTRSVVPGQRTLALHIIAAILDRAICNICLNQFGSASNSVDELGFVDWEAIWAFALGPEPELALSLRMSLDDNHNSVVLACAKAIQCALSYDMNELLFDIAEKTPTYLRDVCTAPVFRSKPDINSGFIRGGFWKYNTKSSNIIPLAEESVGDKDEGEHTIQDDVVVAGQDIAAGLVRMGILSRICYLLETDPAAPLEECLLSILIAIARHSPTCATAIMDCGKLVQTVASRFASTEQVEINFCKVKSVKLFKVLARADKKHCLTFIRGGIFRQVSWHLYRKVSLDQWIKSGKESCKLSSALLVEQLRLWRVFIHYGYYIADFFNIYASLCIWLNVPSVQNLVENDLVTEYFSISMEAYFVLQVIASTLPNLFSDTHEIMEANDQDKESWSWSHFGHIIEQAVEWIQLKQIPHLLRFFFCQDTDDRLCSLKDSEANSFLWVLCSVLNMIAHVLKSVMPQEDMTSLTWLPEFVRKIGLYIVKNGYLNLTATRASTSGDYLPRNGSVVGYLCHLRIKNRKLALSSTCCLQGLVQVIAYVDRLIQCTNLSIHHTESKIHGLSKEEEILASGILEPCLTEIRDVLTALKESGTSEQQPIEMFGRGGPAPGVGVGWGAPGGGYWSLNTLLVQEDAKLLAYFLEVSQNNSGRDTIEAGELHHVMQMLKYNLSTFSTVVPGNSFVIDKLLKVTFQAPLLKHLDYGIRQFLGLTKGISAFHWNYKEEEYQLFANVLSTHFRNRWLSSKQKPVAETDVLSQKTMKTTTMKKRRSSLETIHEGMTAPITLGEESPSLRVEWAHQRLPLPENWFLSAISTIQYAKNEHPPGTSYKQAFTLPSEFLEAAKAGLFFLLGVEAIPYCINTDIYAPVMNVTVAWKLHAMSVTLLSGMGILEDEKSRDVYETLQNICGRILDGEKSHDLRCHSIVGSLQFQSYIHESYSTLVETLVEQFAAESYGDVLFGRQVAIYLHRSVETSVRLATYNALSNARALELLPPLDKCFTKAESYLEPIEGDGNILEAYVKSWVSGALDKAASRSSMAFLLVLHHVSCFIFVDTAPDMLSLRNKLAKTLLRDYSRKQQHEGIMAKLICYNRADMSLQPVSSKVISSLPSSEIEKRLLLLREICGHYEAAAVQKLESRIRMEFSAKTM